MKVVKSHSKWGGGGGGGGCNDYFEKIVVNFKGADTPPTQCPHIKLIMVAMEEYLLFYFFAGLSYMVASKDNCQRTLLTNYHVERITWLKTWLLHFHTYKTSNWTVESWKAIPLHNTLLTTPLNIFRAICYSRAQASRVI